MSFFAVIFINPSVYFISSFYFGSLYLFQFILFFNFQIYTLLSLYDFFSMMCVTSKSEVVENRIVADRTNRKSNVLL